MREIQEVSKEKMPGPAQTVLPRWRGFNLDQMFRAESDLTFSEEDFRWIADWGFDFVRLPLCYLLWVTDGDIFKVREPVLEKVDWAVSLGRKYELHVSVNFHRAPGYCVSRKPHEPFNLWKDDDALDAFCYYWEIFARRYRGISSDDLSFNLVNEPPEPADEYMTRSDHERVIRAAVSTIRGVGFPFLMFKVMLFVIKPPSLSISIKSASSSA